MFSCSVYCSQHKRFTNTACPLATACNHFTPTPTIIRQRRPYKEDLIPPAIRPMLTHMHDPSLFLPSSQSYNPPPYHHFQRPHGTRERYDYEQCVDTATQQNTTTKDYQNYFQKGQRLTKHSVNKFPNGTSFRTMTSTFHSVTDHTPSMTLSTFQGVPDHTPTNNSNEDFFEVPSDWMELTIAREEEVTSSLLDEVHFDIYQPQQNHADFCSSIENHFSSLIPY